jgi:hypothetical protein
MNVSFHIPAEMEHALRQQAALAGQDIEAFLQRMVTEVIADQVPSSPARSRSHAEFMAKLQEVIDLHPRAKNQMDDSRESIYAGCGE